MSPRNRAAAAIACCLLLAACPLTSCVPEVGPPPSQIIGPRVLAVQAEPADVAPGTPITLRLFAADPAGPLSAAALADVGWAFCATPTPASEDNFVSERCLRDPAATLPLAASGPLVPAEVPAEACALFGPQSPPQSLGDPPARPRDADATSGYYQPLRLSSAALALPTIAAVRIQCGLAAAPPDVAAQYRRSYRENAHPHASGLHIALAGQPLESAAVPADRRLTLSLRIPAAQRESFLRFDPSTQALVSDRETLRVSWFSGPGRFQLSTTAATLVSADELAAENEWHSPSQTGPVWLWAVLRDNRGGVSLWSQPVHIN